MLPSQGGIHVVLALESLEAARYAEWLRPGGISLVSEQVITPVSVSAGVDTYPTREQVSASVEARRARLVWLPCVDIATGAGSSRAANVVMLGALSTFLDLPEAAWTSAIAELLPKRIVDVNLRAFEAGRKSANASQSGKDL